MSDVNSSTISYIALNSKNGSGSAVKVGIVTNGSSFPTSRPDSTELQNGDYVTVNSSSTFPFTIGSCTFNSIRDKGVYSNGSWSVETGAYDPNTEKGLQVINNKLEIKLSTNKNRTYFNDNGEVQTDNNVKSFSPMTKLVDGVRVPDLSWQDFLNIITATTNGYNICISTIGGDTYNNILHYADNANQILYLVMPYKDDRFLIYTFNMDTMAMTTELKSFGGSGGYEPNPSKGIQVVNNKLEINLDTSNERVEFTNQGKIKVVDNVKMFTVQGKSFEGIIIPNLDINTFNSIVMANSRGFNPFISIVDGDTYYNVYSDVSIDPSTFNEITYLKFIYRDLGMIVYKYDLTSGELTNEFVRFSSSSEGTNTYETLSPVGMVDNSYEFIADYVELDYQNAKDYFDSDFAFVPYGCCSAIVKDGKLGRNLDFTYDNRATFKVRTSSINGRYAVCGQVGLIDGLEKNFVKSKAYSSLYKVLPFYLMDGHNEKGLEMASLVVPNDKGDTTDTLPTASEKINALMLVRYCLDHYANIDEVIYATGHNLSIYVPQAARDKGYELHYILKDKTKVYVLEFINNLCVWTDITSKPVITNFFINGVTFKEDGTIYEIGEEGIASCGLTLNANGIERYNILVNALSSNQTLEEIMASVKYTNLYTIPFGDGAYLSEYCGSNSLTIESARAAFEETYEEGQTAYSARTRENPVTDQTIYSAIYGDDLTIFTQEDYTNAYHFELPKEVVASGGGIEIVSELPSLANAKEGVLYQVDGPTEGSATTIDRPSSGGTIRYFALQNYMGLPTSYEFNEQTGFYKFIIELPVEQKNKFILMKAKEKSLLKKIIKNYNDGNRTMVMYFPINICYCDKLLTSSVGDLFLELHDSEGADFYADYGDYNYANNYMLPIGKDMSNVPEHSYAKVIDDEIDGYKFYPNTNSYIYGNISYDLNFAFETCWLDLFDSFNRNDYEPCDETNANFIFDNHKITKEDLVDIFAPYSVRVKASAKYDYQAVLREDIAGNKYFEKVNYALDDSYVLAAQDDDHTRGATKNWIKRAIDQIMQEARPSKVVCDDYITEDDCIVPTLYAEHTDIIHGNLTCNITLQIPNINLYARAVSCQKDNEIIGSVIFDFGEYLVKYNYNRQTSVITHTLIKLNSGPTPPADEYTITVGSYDTSLHSLKVDGNVLQPNTPTTFSKGEHIIDIEVADGYNVQEFTINGVSYLGQTPLTYDLQANATITLTIISGDVVVIDVPDYDTTKATFSIDGTTYHNESVTVSKGTHNTQLVVERGNMIKEYTFNGNTLNVPEDTIDAQMDRNSIYLVVIEESNILRVGGMTDQEVVGQVYTSGDELVGDLKGGETLCPSDCYVMFDFTGYNMDYVRIDGIDAPSLPTFRHDFVGFGEHIIDCQKAK